MAAPRRPERFDDYGSGIPLPSIYALSGFVQRGPPGATLFFLLAVRILSHRMGSRNRPLVLAFCFVSNKEESRILNREESVASILPCQLLGALPPGRLFYIGRWPISQT